MIVEFIDANRDEFGVEPICAALQVAPSTYRSAKRRPLSARAMRDAVMMPVLLTLWKANYSVYGDRKLWIAARRAGHDIGRDQVARLMRDLTYVPTWSGVAYVCFIVDAFSRRIVDWRVAAHMRTEMVLDALEMARWSRDTDLEGLRCHSDAGSQFTSIRYGERLAEFGAVPSIGSIGDSFDNALAESTNGLYKAELIRGPDRGPWRTIEDVELATLGWVHWFNTDRIHSYLDDTSPDEFEAAYALGSMCGIDDIDAATFAGFMANEHGMDPISLGSSIAAAMDQSTEMNSSAAISSADRFWR